MSARSDILDAAYESREFGRPGDVRWSAFKEGVERAFESIDATPTDRERALVEAVRNVLDHFRMDRVYPDDPSDFALDFHQGLFQEMDGDPQARETAIEAGRQAWKALTPLDAALTTCRQEQTDGPE